MDYPQFLLFGDSLTEFSAEPISRFYSNLANDYRRRMDVVLRGYGGYNSTWGRHIATKLLQGLHNVKLMYVFFGTNDAVIRASPVPVKLGVEIDVYRNNIKEIVTLAQSQGITVIVVGPTLHDPNGSSKLIMESFPGIGEGPLGNSMRNLEYSNAARGVAEETGAVFVDLWHAFQKESGYSIEELAEEDWHKCPDLSKLLVDGIHFTSEGYRLFYDTLVETIKTKLPEWTPEAVQPLIKYYRDIDMADLDSIFENP